MKRSAKITYIVLTVIAGLAILLIGLNNYAESRIKKSLEENLKKVSATYDKVDVSILSRKAEVINPYFNTGSKTLKVDTIKINDIHLWDYITKKNIIIGNLDISQPVVKIYKRSKPKDSTGKANKKKFKNKLLIKDVNIKGGSLQIFGKDSSQHKLFTSINKVLLQRVKITSETLQEEIPFGYRIDIMELDSIFFDLNEQHEMAAENLALTDNNLNVMNFKIIPKYSKSGHQETIKVEKDRYDLSIDSISLKNFNWSIVNDSLKIQSDLTEIDNVNFMIYRDKLKPDDTAVKPLYSKMIRQLPVKLGLDSVSLRNTYIKYEENIHPDRETGVVEFSNLNAGISNITNIGMNQKDFPKTRIDVNADFMTTAYLRVDWEFDISNNNDHFNISGEMGHLQAEQINKFLTPARNIKANGEILNMYFNFNGNNNSASGDMRVEYRDFKVEVLQKNGKEKNSVVSFFANLIVGNKALNEEANYKDVSFTRDETKSFWNYFWNLIRKGAMKAFL
ncbi:hypothetical protein [Christiangramia crocea]|uniref:DUF748 domain-containing protein n=1 Tax=Christiangramia crocea TaxID=2904124 RepID=A0A9X2A759_9FLAO|nr:hypothetical protein [Gramella crocea]MCG9971566.1 hypothetical protein [Gramella crocea]